MSILTLNSFGAFSAQNSVQSSFYATAPPHPLNWIKFSTACIAIFSAERWFIFSPTHFIPARGDQLITTYVFI